MKRINLAILWHMHQPPYLEPSSGNHLLPWAFLHGMKDYFDMGAVAARHPGMKMTVNFTPSLLEQLQGYAQNTIIDRTIAVMDKAPQDMSIADREYLFRTCFGLNDRMVEPFPRFTELRGLYRSAQSAGTSSPSFEPDEITDITVLYLLAWCGRTMSEGNLFKTLKAKGRGFTDLDRNALLDEARTLIQNTKDLYRSLSERGIVELSTTPYCHPIVPLLCNSFAAVEARPNVVLPVTRFEAPDEARRQIAAGIDGFSRYFGFTPRGMWPAEGSVSEQAVRLYKEAGVQWLATDEEILRRSLGGLMSRQDPLRPHSWNNMPIFFRDHFLSDQIGFVYSRRPTEKAVAEFLAEMKVRADASTSEKDVVVIALDGENAWEYYPDGGYPFLDALYNAIESSDFINPVTMSGYLDRFGPGEPLEVLASGSWIDGNFDTWIGDPVKNQAWDYLAAAQQAAAEADLDTDTRSRVQRHLMRAEASDWFWWFGHGHSSIHEKEFDYLFRKNVRAVYEEAGIAPPDYLERPVGLGTAQAPTMQPTSFISPKITGKWDSYYKWVGAGSCEFSQGSIHRLQPLIKMVRFGFDLEWFYLAAEKFEDIPELMGEGSFMKVVFRRPREFTVFIKRETSGLLRVEGREASGLPLNLQGTSAEAVDLFELAIPTTVFRGRGVTEPVDISFFISIGKNDLEEERFPWDSTVDVNWDPRTFRMNNWVV